MIFYMIKQPLVEESNVESGLWLERRWVTDYHFEVLEFWL